MPRAVKTACVVLILCVLCLPPTVTLCDGIMPASRILTGLVTSHLTGVVLDESRPLLTERSWLDGVYQASYVRWYGQRFALREPLIRLSNQLDYTLFRKSTMEGGQLIIGRDKELYEESYLDDYAGISKPMPIDRLESIVWKMADVQARLQARNVPFLLLITPSKASIYPQYVPDAFQRRVTAPPRNYDNLIPLLAKYGVHYVDGHRMMATEIAKQPYPLFCRGGIHWNDLGASYTIQALLERLGQLSNTPQPQLMIDGVTVTNAGTGQDADLARMLNVIYEPDYFPDPHPQIRLVNKATRDHIVIVGGSFVQRLVDILDTHNVFDSIDYYYYWREKWAFPGHSITRSEPDKIDWRRQIFSANAVILEINEEALSSGENTHYTAFLDDALRHLQRSDSLEGCVRH